MEGNGDQVVLLDAVTDAPIGSMDKLSAHVRGSYHAAISVVLVNRRGQQILQQRSSQKYHAPGLWSNACCSHPLPGESDRSASDRRLREELGIECPLLHFGTIRYRAVVPAPTNIAGQLIEHERVELFGGHHFGPIHPNPAEVSAIGVISDYQTCFEGRTYTPWFQIYMRVFGNDIRQLLLDPSTRGRAPIDFGFYDLTNG